MNLEDIMLSEMGQTQQDKHCLIPLRLKKAGGGGLRRMVEKRRREKKKRQKKKKKGKDQANDTHCYMDIPHKNNLGERSQTQKTMYLMIPFISNAEKEQIYREESRLLVGYPGLGWK